MKGSSSRSGPPPDPNALRRDRDSSEWVTLPASGRVGPAPRWPLTDQTQREKKLWRDLWRMPQAVMWERHHQLFEVALYVRRLVEAEARGSAVNLSTLVRQMADSLGLTTPGLRSNRWKVGHVETAGERRTPAGGSARERFRVVG